MAKPKPKSKPKHGPTPSARPRPAAKRPKAPSLWARLAAVDRWLLLILAVAAVLRFWGIADRLPDVSLGINVLDDTAIEETDRTTTLRSWQMWQGGLKAFDLNPHTGGWPALSFYLTLAIQLGYKVWYGFTHAGATTRAFGESVQRDPAALFLLARIVNAIIGIASVALTYRLAAAWIGRTAALLAALFLAANPLHILTSQHISDPNLLALVFVALAMIAMARVAEGGGIRDSVMAGACIGLAAACKYAPIVLLVPLALAHVPGRRWKALGIAAAVVVAAMFVATPFTFLDWPATSRAFVVQKRSLFSDWVGQSAFPISLPTYLIASLPKALGWPVYVLSLAGFVALWRGGRVGRLVTVAAGVILLANGMLRAAQERYMLVAYPMFMAAAGAGAVWLVKLLAARVAALRAPGRGAAVAFAGLALAGIAAPAPEFLAIREALRRPDSRHEARRWINANVGLSRKMGIELYGPVFRENERNIAIWPFFATQAPLVAPAYHVAFLDGVEIMALSGEISRRFLADSLKYPDEAAYYRWLQAHGPILWQSDGDGRKLSGPKIELRAVPPNLSTRAERDSLFAKLQPTPSGTYRLALWCNDMALLFSRAGEYGRMEEWALRGLEIRAVALMSRLYATLALARLNLENFAGAEEAARLGLASGTNTFPPLRLYRGMALERLGRYEEALGDLQAGFERTQDPRVHLNIAQVLVTLRRYEEAVAELAQVPQGTPERAAASRDMAVILLTNLGRREEGLAALREAAALEQDPAQAALLRNEVARLEHAMGAPR